MKVGGESGIFCYDSCRNLLVLVVQGEGPAGLVGRGVAAEVVVAEGEVGGVDAAFFEGGENLVESIALSDVGEVEGEVGLEAAGGLFGEVDFDGEGGAGGGRVVGEDGEVGSFAGVGEDFEERR